eukprot:CAMPEP_0182426114 /NCGR_PEP_ID=MMETSP1167-20130531/12592_1 /TAXON_ID=2988 /ORGANISM="Mallomonas Sp, Strain CCMP3275" /LENGTH=337 /DNA_ID=CAMNT_0024607323 /DNA_START=1 /DNA_END=1014 /DNA_ORIENTATION=+
MFHNYKLSLLSVSCNIIKTDSKKKRKHIKSDSFSHISNTISTSSNKEEKERKKVKESERERERERESTSTSDSVSDSSSDDREEEEEEEEMNRSCYRKEQEGSESCRGGHSVIGPAAPSQEQLLFAQSQAALQAHLHRDSDTQSDSDDQQIGPTVCGIDSMSRTLVSSPGEMGGQTLAGEVIPSRPAVPLSSLAAPVTEREEWMLTPGEAKHMAGLTESFGVSRGFQAGKVARKTAAELGRQREAEREREEDTEETKRTQAILQEYRELRGPSLMDAHLEKRKSNRPVSGDTTRPFDRERDVLSRHAMDANAANRLVEQAKNLDTRFDKGSVQRNFL